MKRFFYFMFTFGLFAVNISACSSGGNSKTEAALHDSIIAVSPFYDLTSYDPHNALIFVMPITENAPKTVAEAIKITANSNGKTFEVTLLPTGQRSGEYKLDLPNEYNSSTPIDITYEALSSFRLRIAENEYLLKRTVHLNQSQEVKVVELDICKKKYTVANVTFNEKIKGAITLIFQFNLKKGQIEGRNFDETSDGVHFIGPEKEDVADGAAYKLDSDIFVEDIQSVEIKGEVYSPSKEKNITISGIKISDGKWYKVNEVCYRWFSN